MAIFECTSPVTRRSLMNKSKDELATRVLELHREIGGVRDRLERTEAQVTDLKEELRLARFAQTQATRCAGCGQRKHTPLRVDRMGGYVCLTCVDTKLHELLAVETPVDAELAAAIAPLFAPEPTRDSDLPACGSFHG